MRAAVIVDTELRVEERPTPLPSTGQVVLRVHAAGINAADLLQRAGHYPAPPGVPSDIPGLEVMGVVEAIGDGVDASWRGKRVCAIVGGGAQATHAMVAADHLLPVPDHVTDSEAGGFAEAYSTAFDALVCQAKLAPGERVLISGAAGGVGTAAVQLARSLGAQVTAVVRHRDHEQSLRTLGATAVITIDDLGTAGPFDVVLELVGAAHLAVAQHHLAPFARVVVIGVSGGSLATLDLLGIMRRRVTLTGSTLRSRSEREKALLATLMRSDVLPRWERGELTVPVMATFDLSAIEDAYHCFATPGKFGKIVVTMGEA